MARSKSTSAAGAQSRRPSDHFDDELVRSIRAAPAIYTDETMMETERVVQADGHGYARRIALGVLKNTGAHIMAQVAKDRATAVDFAEAEALIQRYLRHLKGLTAMAEAAQVRICIALAQRVDMDQVLAEGEAMVNSDGRLLS